jgi:hypothetical protein
MGHYHKNGGGLSVFRAIQNTTDKKIIKMTLDELFEQARKEYEGIPWEKRERKEWVEHDPITGGTMTVVTIGKCFLMQIPHQEIKLTHEQQERFKNLTALYGERKWDRDSDEIQFITNRKPNTQ